MTTDKIDWKTQQTSLSGLLTSLCPDAYNPHENMRLDVTYDYINLQSEGAALRFKRMLTPWALNISRTSGMRVVNVRFEFNEKRSLYYFKEKYGKVILTMETQGSIRTGRMHPHMRKVIPDQVKNALAQNILERFPRPAEKYPFFPANFYDIYTISTPDIARMNVDTDPQCNKVLSADMFTKFREAARENGAELCRIIRDDENFRIAIYISWNNDVPRESRFRFLVPYRIY